MDFVLLRDVGRHLNLKVSVQWRNVGMGKFWVRMTATTLLPAALLTEFKRDSTNQTVVQLCFRLCHFLGDTRLIGFSQTF